MAACGKQCKQDLLTRMNFGSFATFLAEFVLLPEVDRDSSIQREDEVAGSQDVKGLISL